MRRRRQRSAEACMCPVCKKVSAAPPRRWNPHPLLPRAQVVEFGVVCDNCAAWFHTTESCCGDALADAFLRTGKGPWCCLNCFPHAGERPVADKMMAPAATAEVLDWRRAFHIFTDSCAGCGLQACRAARTTLSALQPPTRCCADALSRRAVCRRSRVRGPCAASTATSPSTAGRAARG